jgi:hypothetical protein
MRLLETARAKAYRDARLYPIKSIGRAAPCGCPCRPPVENYGNLAGRRTSATLLAPALEGGGAEESSNPGRHIGQQRLDLKQSDRGWTLVAKSKMVSNNQIGKVDGILSTRTRKKGSMGLT